VTVFMVVVMLVFVFVLVLVLVLVFVLVAARPGDIEALADEGTALALPEADAKAADAHRLDGGRDDRSGHTQIDEGGHRHVSGDARAGLEVQVQATQRLHESRFRFNIAAIWPAPKPLSMFTTAMPAAQELSIPSKAAKPPRFAP